MYLLELVLEVWPAHTNTSTETTLPLGDSSIHDRLVKAFPLGDQTLSQFIHVSNSGWVNCFLRYTTDAMYTVLRSGEFVGHSVGGMKLSTFRFRNVTVPHAQCAVLSKDKNPP